MAFVAAKCTQCGASLNVDQEKDAAICPFCKTPFITEKAINYYNTTNVTNIGTINAEVVNVESSDSVSNLCHTAETLMNFSEWDKAKEIYVKISELYPFDWRGWYGILQTTTHNFRLYFGQYEEYTALAEVYEKLMAVSGGSIPNIASVKEYLDVTYEKVKAEKLNKLSADYTKEQQYLQSRIAYLTENIDKNIPVEIKDERSFGLRTTRVIWIVWVAIAVFFSLASGIISAISGESLYLEAGPFRFSQMDSFWDVTLFASIMMLIVQVVISFGLFIVNILGLIFQKLSKQKKLTAIRFFNIFFIIAVSSHLIFWLITIFIVGINDTGVFLSFYGGTYRHVETILFHSKATETGACWIALLLIIIYSIINYALIAAPLFATERIGNKKRKAIQQNAEYNRELLRLLERKEDLPTQHNNKLLGLKMLEKKHS